MSWTCRSRQVQACRTCRRYNSEMLLCCLFPSIRRLCVSRRKLELIIDDRMIYFMQEFLMDNILNIRCAAHELFSEVPIFCSKDLPHAFGTAYAWLCNEVKMSKTNAPKKSCSVDVQETRRSKDGVRPLGATDQQAFIYFRNFLFVVYIGESRVEISRNVNEDRLCIKLESVASVQLIVRHRRRLR